MAWRLRFRFRITFLLPHLPLFWSSLQLLHRNYAASTNPTNQKADYGREISRRASRRPLCRFDVPAYWTHCWAGIWKCYSGECAYANGCPDLAEDSGVEIQRNCAASGNMCAVWGVPRACAVCIMPLWTAEVKIREF